MTVTLSDLITAAADTVIAHTEELTALDSAIGDGDHGANMKRGLGAVRDELPDLEEKAFGEALRAAGMKLVMTVGGASGPLYGTLFMGMGKSLDGAIDRDAVTAAFGEAIEAVKARGKSERGQKTMLDVLIPVHEAMVAGAGLDRIRQVAAESAEATIPMIARKGRASFLGERSAGHLDPGARSSQLMIEAVCDALGGAT